jgi:transcription termination factor Rho
MLNKILSLIPGYLIERGVGIIMASQQRLSRGFTRVSSTESSGRTLSGSIHRRCKKRPSKRSS